jgi:hypothetical protein
LWLSGLFTFRRLAVSGSIIDRTSFTNWLTLDPTSPAPTRMTMLFGDLFIDADPALTPAGADLRCVRFLERRLAMII